ncbi:hypothetical protein [Tautonia rosea]|uniref:hypothetical protein n=1 Tax=Tautonia rosea TaxID=2728037 RepID=UPI0014732BAD|nr:hypothetical protein [Tautonia rosea]
MTLRVARVLVLVGSVLLLLGLGLLLRDPRVPLGVPGEWTWARLGEAVEPVAVSVGLGLAGLAVYVAFVAIGRRDLGRSVRGWRREAIWLIGLLVMGVFAQLAALSAAPPGYGTAKMVTLAMSGSSGYYNVARTEMTDVAGFLDSYPQWIREQDVYHIGTHPPGLFLTTWGALAAMDAFPGLARGIDERLPVDLVNAFREILGPMPRADRAALVLIAALTLMICAGTAVPLYLLMRGSGRDPAVAWSAASLWPLVPSAILFQPTADTAFPLLAVSALALATRRGAIAAALSGVVLAVGMVFTLAFLAVGLMVALMIVTSPGVSIRRRAGLILATGAGFLTPTVVGWLVTGANPFLIWWWNQANHAGFYVEHPRRYAAWLLINPIELTVALGLPAAVWAGVGLASGRAPRVSWIALGVLVLLTVSGRSLSEVARLWIPFCPMLLAASAAGQARLGGGAVTLAVTALLMAIQVVMMQLTIQVVYPDV